jgi:amino acid transporter
MGIIMALPVIALIASFIIGLVLIIVPFFPSIHSNVLPDVTKNREDPKSNIDNLTEYGKNMVYAGIALFLIPIFIVFFGIKYFKKELNI